MSGLLKICYWLCEKMLAQQIKDLSVSQAFAYLTSPKEMLP